jgi:WhiB family redox-sensing transcriptional regulator
MDVDLFYPKVGEVMPDEALNACRNCPVSDDCLDWALLHPEHHGIWAGTSEKRRVRMRRQRRRHGDRRALCRICSTPFDKTSSQAATCSRCAVVTTRQRRGA